MDIQKGIFPSTFLFFLGLFSLSLLLHFPFLNKDLIGVHVWRQTQTQTGIDNFCQEGNSILNPTLNSNPETDRIVRLEFPLMQWGFAQVEKHFSNPVLITRLLSFLISLISAFAMFLLAKQLGLNQWLSYFSAWLFTFSPLIFYYAINPLPDNLALCTGILGIAIFFLAIRKDSTLLLLLSSLFFGLSVLIKLPYIINLSLPFLVILNKWFSKAYSLKKAFTTGVCMILFQVFPLTWYSWVIPQWGNSGVVEGILAADKSLPFYLRVMQDILISTLPELIINYAALPLFIAGLIRITRHWKVISHTYLPFVGWGLTLIAFFIYDSPIIANVHDYYLFPFVPALVLISLAGINQVWKLKKNWIPYLIGLCLVCMPLTAYLRVVSRFNEKSPGFNRLILENKNELRSLGNNNDRWIVGSDWTGVIYLYYTQRKGWTYENNLDSNRLKHYLMNNAKYLLTDNSLDTASQIKPFLGRLVWSKEQLKVYELHPQAGK